jgi:hypothetical protein
VANLVGPFRDGLREHGSINGRNAVIRVPLGRGLLTAMIATDGLVTPAGFEPVGI